MEGHGPTNWVQYFPIPFTKLHETGVIAMDPRKLEHLNASILVTILIAIFSVLAARRIRGHEEKYIVPPKRATLAGLADFLMETVYGMVHGTLGANTPKYFAFVGSLFVFILASNLFGMMPYSGAPTSSINTTLALGLASFVFYNVMGIREMGLGNYIAHFFMGLGLLMGSLVAFFEVISHLLRPITLSGRLMMNIRLDHEILHNFEKLCAWLVPVPLLLFGLVVCIIQAFVFATLTAVYIQLATEVHEHEESHHH